MTTALPARPNIEHLKKQAKQLLKAHNAADPSACTTLRRLHRFTNATDDKILAAPFTLKEVQFALAMEHGFKDWDALKRHVESLSAEPGEGKPDAGVVLQGNGHSEDAFSLTFAAAANRLGQDAPYEDVFPLSTNPFAPAFYLPELCPSFWHQRGREHGLDVLAARFGLHCEELRLPDTHINPVSEPQRAPDRVRRALPRRDAARMRRHRRVWLGFTGRRPLRLVDVVRHRRGRPC